MCNGGIGLGSMQKYMMRWENSRRWRLEMAYGVGDVFGGQRTEDGGGLTAGQTISVSYVVQYSTRTRFWSVEVV